MIAFSNNMRETQYHDIAHTLPGPNDAETPHTYHRHPSHPNDPKPPNMSENRREIASNIAFYLVKYQ